jgi:hypothetical protein
MTGGSFFNLEGPEGDKLKTRVLPPWKFANTFKFRDRNFYIKKKESFFNH